MADLNAVYIVLAMKLKAEIEPRKEDYQRGFRERIIRYKFNNPNNPI